jgi:hypothetical protein
VGEVRILWTEIRTSPISRAVVDRAQQANKRRANHTRLKDNCQRNCSAASSGTPCGTGDGDFGMSESLFPLGSPFAYRYRGRQNGWELPSVQPRVQIWPPPWKITWDGITTRLMRQSGKPYEAAFEELEQSSITEAYSRFCNAGRNS